MIFVLYGRDLIRSCLFLLPLWVLFFSTSLSAQQLKMSFELIPNTADIPLGKINSIVQDSRGFIWLSDQSNGALIRYDGSHMQSYNFDPHNSNSLGGAYPECLYVTDSGEIMIGFYGQGLDRFDPFTHTFTHYRHDPGDPKSLANDNVWVILQDHLGNIWVGSDGGLSLFDPNTGNFTHFTHKEDDPFSLSYDVVRSLYEDRAGTLWVGTGFPYDYTTTRGGLNRFERSTGTFTRFLHDPEDPKSLISNKVRAILEDSHGNFWVGTDGDGLHSMDRETNQFTRHTFDATRSKKLSRPPLKSEEDHITFLIEDLDNQIWIGTSHGGTNRYNPLTKKITYLGASTPDLEAVVDNAAWRAFAENSSSWVALVAADRHVWVSTEINSRLFKIDLRTHYIPFYTDKQGYPSFYEEGSGVLWTGTNNGLVREDPHQGTYQRFKHDPKNPSTLSSDRVISMTQDHTGLLWIGTRTGLDHVEPSTGIIRRYRPDLMGSSVYPQRVTNIHEDGENNIWIGTFANGLFLWDRDTETFTQFQSIPKDLASLSGNDVSTILEDAHHSIWIGTVNDGAGLNRYDKQTQTFKRYLPGLPIMNLLSDHNDVLWAGTANGLYKYNRDNDRFENSGVSSSITTVINDLDNNLWLYTSNGIIRYDQQTETSMLLNERNGVQGILRTNEFFHPFRSQNGTIRFSLGGGYYVFSPDDIIMSVDTSPLHFTDLRINGISITQVEGGGPSYMLSSASPIKLDYSQNTFSVHFTAIDYKQFQKLRLSYLLEDYDDQWRWCYPEDPAFYLQVPPGKYRFKIRANNSLSGILSERSLPIYIAHPWWNTWGAYFVYALLFVLGIRAVHLYQKNRVLQKERQKTRERELAQAKEIEKAYRDLKNTQAQLIHSEKMASLGELTAGIAHEIQNPLNFMNNFSDVNRELIEEMIIEMKQGNIAEALTIGQDLIENESKIVHHGKRAESIVKGMLMHSRSVGREKEPTDLNLLCEEYLRLAFHGFKAKQKDFAGTLRTDFQPDLDRVNVVPQEFGRVVLNLINNALYAVSEKQKDNIPGYQPMVTVKTTKSDGRVKLEVSDNGAGIPDGILDKIFQPFYTTKPTGEGTGLGLSLSYDIVTKGHGGELLVDTVEGEGTTFTIKI